MESSVPLYSSSNASSAIVFLPFLERRISSFRIVTVPTRAQVTPLSFSSKAARFAGGTVATNRLFDSEKSFSRSLQFSAGIASRSISSPRRPAIAVRANATARPPSAGVVSEWTSSASVAAETAL